MMARLDDLATALFAAATARLEEAHDAAVAGQRSGRPVAAMQDSAEAVTGKCVEARILGEAAVVVRGRDHGQD